MNKAALISYLSIFFILTANSQIDYSQNFDFHPPLNIDLVLSANFGELRTNHFHTGIDFKTNGKEGYKLYSIADGYVSRVRVSPYGYGLVVYIDHYNGLTSVYAHCSQFVGKIADMVSSRQLKEQNYEIEYYPPKDSLKVLRGEVIALSGNSGRSFGPHLHFEIRETKSEMTLNPLLFGFNIPDHRKPKIRRIKVYALTAEGYRIPNRSKSYSVIEKNGAFTVPNDKITIPAEFTSAQGGVGFAFDAIDQLDGANNICGIYMAQLIVNEDTLFEQSMEQISFETNRYINSHKDYEEFHQSRKQYHKAFKTSHNPLPIYLDNNQTGIIKISPGEQKKINYLCEDVNGNRSELKFVLEIEDGIPGKASDYYLKDKKYLYPDSVYLSMNDQHYIRLPLGVVYEPTPLIMADGTQFQFGQVDVPVQEYYNLRLPISNKTLTDEKYVVVNQQNSAFIGQVENDWLSVNIREFGEFSIVVDSIAPKILETNCFEGSTGQNKTFFWKLADDVSGITDYDVFIDEQWQLLAYDDKTKRYSLKMLNEFTGSKVLKLKVSDGCGNTLVKSYSINF